MFTCFHTKSTTLLLLILQYTMAYIFSPFAERKQIYFSVKTHPLLTVFSIKTPSKLHDTKHITFMLTDNRLQDWVVSNAHPHKIYFQSILQLSFHVSQTITKELPVSGKALFLELDLSNKEFYLGILRFHIFAANPTLTSRDSAALPTQLHKFMQVSGFVRS